MLIGPQSQRLKSLTYCVDSIPRLLRPFMWVFNVLPSPSIVTPGLCVKYSYCIHFQCLKRGKGGPSFPSWDTHKISGGSGQQLNLTNPADL